MKVWDNNYMKDIMIAIIITISPLLIYLHLIFNSKVKEFVILGYDINHNFKSQEQFVWYIMIKFLPVILLSIWIITTRFKWKYYILIPLVLYFDSLVRLTLLSAEYSYKYGIIFSVICNVMFISLLMICSRWYYQKFGDEIMGVFIKEIILNNSKRRYLNIIEIIDRFKEKIQSNNLKYFQNLYQLKTFLEEYLSGTKISTLNKILPIHLRRVIIGLFLFMPILFNIHHAVPTHLQSIDFAFIKITSNGFQSVDVLIWLFFVKLTFLISICLWFVTCQYWWKYAILSPITLVSYQIWEMFQDVRYIDAWGNVRALPFVLFIVLTLIIISNCIKYEFKVSALHLTISKEVDDLIAVKARQEQLYHYKEKLRNIKNAARTRYGKNLDDLKVLKDLRENIIRDLDIEN